MKKDRIGFIVSERYIKDVYPWNLVEFCKEQGHEVQIIIPEQLECCVDEFEVNCSIYIHRNHCKKGLDILSKVEKSVQIFNCSKSVLNCQNKLKVQEILNNSDLLLPEEIKFETIDSQCDKVFPIITKPIFGNNGEGISIFRSREEWLKQNLNHSKYIIQRYIENDGCDIKLYCIDNEVFAVRKQSPVHKNKNIKTELIECTKAMKEVAVECSKIFNLNIFGVDTIISKGGEIYAIEVNECSSFLKVPDLPNRMYSYITKILSV